MAECHDDTIRWISEMRLRDYFAAQAMQALCVEGERQKIWAQICGPEGVMAKIADLSYKMADAMLVERAKEQK